MKRFNAIIIPAIIAVICITGASGCRRHPPTHTDIPLAAQMDDSVLTVSEVERIIPAGLSPEDSAAMAQEIISGWIEDHLFDVYLSKDPGEEEKIERRVADYRRRLRMEAYRRRMRRLREPPVNADSVRAYYEAHKMEMLTEHPLIKGLYLKVPDNNPELEKLRGWCQSGSAEDVKAIEEASGNSDFVSEYFGDKWIEFDILASEIPYRFGDPDSFVSHNENFETSGGGYHYFLHIYDHLQSGSVMPYDFAEIQIRDILQESRLEAYRRGLLKALRSKGIKEGRLKIF